LPAPTLLVNPSRALVDEPITFTAVLDPGITPPQYHFYFDDGSDEGSEGNQIVHSYRQAGEYHPYVAASFGHGDEIVNSAQIQVAIDAPLAEVKPQLTVALVTREPTTGRNVTVEASLESPHESVRYEYDWGDGTLPEDAGPSSLATHKYKEARLYTVRVSAWTRGKHKDRNNNEKETGPVTGSVQVFVQRAWWPPDPTNALLVLLLGAGVAVGSYLARHIRTQPRPEANNLRVTGHPDAGQHRISNMGRTDSRISLTLRLGQYPSTDRITFI
jgi:hypothetical protein